MSELTAGELTTGFPPRPGLNLRFFGGRTIAHLVFANHYLGGAAAWVSADIASIDAALAKAMSDNDLQSVIQQEAGTSRALVFREVDLADGSGAVPVQLMWSNKTSTPATRLA